MISDAGFLFAFVGVPIIVVIVGYVAVRLHERDLDRKKGHPAE